MNIVERATGQKQLNTMAMGGTVVRGQGMTEPVARMTTGGVQFQGEQLAGFTSRNIFDYGNIHQGRPRVAASAGSPEEQAAFKEAGLNRQGGGVISPQTQASIPEFNLYKRMGADRRYPSEGAINIAGQTAVGVGAAKGSTGAVTQGPPALQPTGKDKLDILGDKLDIVNRLLSDIKSGIPVTNM